MLRTALCAHHRLPLDRHRGVPCPQSCRRTRVRPRPTGRPQGRTCRQTCQRKRQAPSPRNRNKSSLRKRLGPWTCKRAKAPDSPLCSGKRRRLQDRPRLHRLLGPAPCSGPSLRTAGTQAMPCQRPRSGHMFELQRSSGRQRPASQLSIPKGRLPQKPAQTEFERSRRRHWRACSRSPCQSGACGTMRRLGRTPSAATESRGCRRAVQPARGTANFTLGQRRAATLGEIFASA